jgi:hypothetical protein
MEASPGSVDGLKIDYVPMEEVSIVLKRHGSETVAAGISEGFRPVKPEGSLRV